MDAISIAVAILLALAVFLIANSVLQTVVTVGQRVGRRTRRGVNRVYGLMGSGLVETKKEELSEDEILGLPKLPWTTLYVVTGIVGVMLFVFFNRDLGWIAWLLLAMPVMVYLFRRYLIRQRTRFMLAQVRHLLIDLRLRLSLYGSLVLSLNSIAETAENTPVGRALKRHFAGGLPQSGVAVLEQMVLELRSPYLDRAVQRLKAAQQAGGTLDLDKALDSSIDEITTLINSQAEEQMQKIPLRITLLAMPFLLGPVVILGFYPLVDRVLKTLSGMPLGGGGF